MFDAVIIGAGPCGTSAAYDLLESKKTVLLIDKYDFPRKKACAGGITPKGYKAFAYDILSQIKTVCHEVKVTPSTDTSFIIKNRQPLCYMVDRKELDEFSLKLVIRKGAVFKKIKKILAIKEFAHHVEIQTTEGHFKSRYLIGADGANSIVRKLVRTDVFYQKQMAVEADVVVDHPDQFSMEFDFSHPIKGYYWIFPKKDHVNIGIYSTGASIHLGTEKLHEYARRRCGTDRINNIKGYPICTNGFIYRPDSDRIFLAGDAAGMGERMLGEGIYFALATGRLAASAIIRSQHVKYSARQLYDRSLKKIRRDLKLYDLASKCLYRFTGLSLKLLSFKPVHGFFASGYARGRTLSDILSFHLIK